MSDIVNCRFEADLNLFCNKKYLSGPLIIYYTNTHEIAKYYIRINIFVSNIISETSVLQKFYRVVFKNKFRLILKIIPNKCWLFKWRQHEIILLLTEVIQLFIDHIYWFHNLADLIISMQRMPCLDLEKRNINILNGIMMMMMIKMMMTTPSIWIVDYDRRVENDGLNLMIVHS